MHSSHRVGPIPFREFVSLIAAMMACQAIAVDAMLPALTGLAQDLAVSANRTQGVVTTYVAGLGVGQLFWGVLSDRLGRRPVMLTGVALYGVASLLSAIVSSFEGLLALRLVQGIAGASFVTSRTVVRDLYDGRRMARVLSLTFVVFITVPIVAPSIGQVVLLLAGWRCLSVLFGVMAIGIWFWIFIRLPETLNPKYRIALTWGRVAETVSQVFRDPASCWYTLATAALFGSIVAYCGMMQQIFMEVFHKPGMMPSIFALCASVMGLTSFVNSSLVERVGMRIVSQIGVLALVAVSGVHVLVSAIGRESLEAFVFLQALTLGCFGLTLANFGAMAMESMGSIAGVAASLQGSITTFGGALIAILIGREFNGSTLPLEIGTAICSIAALVCVLIAERWRLFYLPFCRRGQRAL